ncbi:hypothetical protein Scep_009730 [Stephania cephalantha]|uniref:Disease resistance N-terminal domain-containing protein n=1 Tax=Stephania cephalantha TaxID=152367 RepID=A0AAP0PEL4_9MAGN
MEIINFDPVGNSPNELNTVEEHIENERTWTRHHSMLERWVVERLLDQRMSIDIPLLHGGRKWHQQQRKASSSMVAPVRIEEGGVHLVEEVKSSTSGLCALKKFYVFESYFSTKSELFEFSTMKKDRASMVEDILVGGVEDIGNRLIFLGIDEIALLRSVKRDVQKLQMILSNIQVMLQHAKKEQEKNEKVRLWLENLKLAAFDVEDV